MQVTALLTDLGIIPVQEVEIYISCLACQLLFCLFCNDPLLKYSSEKI